MPYVEDEVDGEYQGKGGPPASPSVGALWFDGTTKKSLIYDGEAWVELWSFIPTAKPWEGNNLPQSEASNLEIPQADLDWLLTLIAGKRWPFLPGIASSPDPEANRNLHLMCLELYRRGQIVAVCENEGYVHWRAKDDSTPTDH